MRICKKPSVAADMVQCITHTGVSGSLTGHEAGSVRSPSLPLFHSPTLFSLLFLFFAFLLLFFCSSSFFLPFSFPLSCFFSLRSLLIRPLTVFHSFSVYIFVSSFLLFLRATASFRSTSPFITFY